MAQSPLQPIVGKFDLRRYVSQEHLFEMICVGIFAIELIFFAYVYVHPKLFYAPPDPAAAMKHGRNAPAVQVATVVPDQAGSSLGAGPITTSAPVVAKHADGKHGHNKESKDTKTKDQEKAKSTTTP